MGDLIGYNANHYARIERAELPLLLEKATDLAMRLNISRDSIYLRPVEDEPEPTAVPSETPGSAPPGP